MTGFAPCSSLISVYILDKHDPVVDIIIKSIRRKQVLHSVIWFRIFNRMSTKDSQSLIVELTLTALHTWSAFPGTQSQLLRNICQPSSNGSSYWGSKEIPHDRFLPFCSRHSGRVMASLPQCIVWYSSPRTHPRLWPTQISCTPSLELT